MLCRLLLTAALALAVLSAQGTKPKEKATDYPVHAQLPGFEIGAEYLVHSVPAARGVIDVNDYLVIEVAIFPVARGSETVNSGEFTLRINGKKSVLFTQPVGIVAASVKYPDWETRPTVEASGGMGNAGVILGRPPVIGRFPGDNRPAESRLPPRPTAPEQPNPTGEEKPPDVPIGETITQAALPEGPVKGTVSGCLFFAFKGKTKGIHSLELLYQSGDGKRETALRLF